MKGRPGLDRTAPAATAIGLAALALLPLVVRRDDVLNLGVIFLLSVALAQSWNVVAGLAGQVNLGHAAFFGLSALLTRTLWIAGTPVVAAMAAGTAVAAAAGLVLGLVAFRLRGAYFAIGTLALAEVLRLYVGNVLPEISTLPAATIAGYRLLPRYYAALALALGSVVVVTAVAWSRLGLGMQAVREDEAAAEASGVGAFAVKLQAVAVSTGLAGLAGGVFAYYHISFYPQFPFHPAWTFDAVLMTFIGGAGVFYGPIVGTVLIVFLQTKISLLSAAWPVSARSRSLASDRSSRPGRSWPRWPASASVARSVV